MIISCLALPWRIIPKDAQNLRHPPFDMLDDVSR
jgi:hypothetical protein